MIGRLNASTLLCNMVRYFFNHILGQLVCTHLRCPEAGHHYTSYKDIGLRNAEPENFSKNIVTEKPVRNPDACLECDHLPGPYVCGRKQWKTFPSLCHAIFCGKNQDNDIKERSCETLVRIYKLACLQILLIS